MTLNLPSFFRKSQKYLFLIAGYLLSYGWSMQWQNELLLDWWSSLHGILPDRFFFCEEELIAQNSHRNEWPPMLGFGIIILYIIILSIHERKNEIRLGNLIFMIILFLACAANMFPCLCHAKEYDRRVRCRSSMKAKGLALSAYILDNKCFPEKATIENSHSQTLVIDFPAGKLSAANVLSSSRTRHVLTPEICVTASGRTEQSIPIIHGKRKEAASELRQTEKMDSTVDKLSTTERLRPRANRNLRG